VKYPKLMAAIARLRLPIGREAARQLRTNSEIETAVEVEAPAPLRPYFWTDGPDVEDDDGITFSLGERDGRKGVIARRGDEEVWLPDARDITEEVQREGISRLNDARLFVALRREQFFYTKFGETMPDNLPGGQSGSEEEKTMNEKEANVNAAGPKLRYHLRTEIEVPAGDPAKALALVETIRNAGGTVEITAVRRPSKK